jgi:hypothetical protein
VNLVDEVRQHNPGLQPGVYQQKEVRTLVLNIRAKALVVEQLVHPGLKPRVNSWL